MCIIYTATRQVTIFFYWKTPKKVLTYIDKLTFALTNVTSSTTESYLKI